jgi:acyl carrier protein
MQEDSEFLLSVLDVLREVGGIANLQPDEDFYDAGITSLQALPLLLELEARFEVAIPDEQFVAARTARGLCELVRGVRQP